MSALNVGQAPYPMQRRICASRVTRAPFKTSRDRVHATCVALASSVLLAAARSCLPRVIQARTYLAAATLPTRTATARSVRQAASAREARLLQRHVGRGPLQRRQGHPSACLASPAPTSLVAMQRAVFRASAAPSAHAAHPSLCRAPEAPTATLPASRRMLNVQLCPQASGRPSAVWHLSLASRER